MLQILIIIGVTGVLFSLRSLYNRWMYKLREKKEKQLFQPKKLSREETFIQDTLQQLDYFKNLSSEGQQKFITRTHKVLMRLSFSTAGNIEADSTKRALIVASIIQLTFGLDDFDIDTIEHVKIFENNIYNPRTRVQYKGLTFMNGNMYLSWDHFLKGIEIKDDGIHLGLHETAHGLFILLKNSAYRDFDKVLEKWYENAKHEIVTDEAESSRFLRRYASTNLEEFFSVCVENFFERPKEFKKRLPAIYAELSVFLNQDPANPADYAYVAPAFGPASGESRERLYLHKNKWSPSHTFFILFSYFSLIAILILKKMLMETLFNIILFSIPCMFITYYSFKKIYLDSRRMTKGQYLLFSITAINPVILFLVLAINVMIPVSGSYKKIYRPTGAYRQMAFALGQNDFAVLDNTKTIYLLDGNDTVPIDLRTFDKEEYQGKLIEYTYHYGLTGLKVFDSVEVKNE